MYRQRLRYREGLVACVYFHIVSPFVLVHSVDIADRSITVLR